MTVLVLTRTADATADFVITELNRRGVPLWRMDPGDFPTALTLSARIGPGDTDWWGYWNGQHRGLSFDEVSAVYYRRPSAHRINPAVPEGERAWATDEASAGFAGLLAALRGCVWLNHPHCYEAASVAPLALAEAGRCGLTIPQTLITNNPERAQEFLAALPGRVAAYKPLGRNQPTRRDGKRYVVWTDRVRHEEITNTVALSAHLFQEWIDKAYEVRLTAVNEAMFAAEIHAGSDAARLDFRRDYDALTYRVCDVPQPIGLGVQALLRAFSLRYVALDFLVDHNGRWYLVDVNPSGQWAFIPDLREPITHAIADALEGRP